jgi:hypothetical protein
MLTIVVMLSGPHRFEMLEKAIASIPIDSPHVTEVQIRHQGGPWDWGGELRQRLEAHPKVRVIEFPDWVDFAKSYNRTLDNVHTPWAVLLPDDDFLLANAAEAAFDAVAEHSATVSDCGFVAFGWYYLKDGRYLASHVKRRGLQAALRYAPKLCSTLLNVRRVRELGGFDGSVGGFNDTLLFGKLAFEYDALIGTEPIGIYRMHEGQESAKMQSVYAPYVDTLVKSLGRYARDPKERQDFERELANYVDEGTKPTQMASLIEGLNFRLRGRAQPVDAKRALGMRKWSTI